MKKTIFLSILMITALAGAASYKRFRQPVILHDSLKVGSSAVNDASILLEMDSTSKGFRAPSMTTAERDSITTPAEGLMIWNTTTKTYDQFNGTIWAQIGTQNLAKVTVNDTTADFLGTKLVAGSNVTLTVLNPGANETLEIAAAGGGGGGGEVPDDTFRIVDNTDATKKLAFEVAGITTATTQTWTVADEALDLQTGVGGSFANSSLSNLGSTAVNTNIFPDITETHQIGQNSQSWLRGYFHELRSPSHILIRPTISLFLQTVSTIGNVNIEAELSDVLIDARDNIALETTIEDITLTSASDLVLTATNINATGAVNIAGDTAPTIDGTYDMGSVALNFSEIHTQNILSNTQMTIDAGANALNLGGSEIAIQGLVQISGVGTPTNSDHAATKGYVDSVSTGGPEFASNVFRVFDDSDNTKKVSFDLSGLPTATTVPIAMPIAPLNLNDVAEHLDLSPARHLAGEVQFVDVATTAKNITALDSIETVTTKLDDAIGDLSFVPANYPDPAADIVADHLGEIDTTIGDLSFVSVNYINPATGIIADHLSAIDTALTTGAGDVSGPGSSIDREIVVWNGVTGTSISGSGLLWDGNGGVSWQRNTATGTLLSLKTLDDSTANNALEILNSSDVAVWSVGADGSQLFNTGSVSAPGITFTGDTDTGIYSPTANAVGITGGGTASIFFTGSNIQPQVQTQHTNSTAASPSYSFTGMVDGGMYRESASDELRIAVNGVDKITLSDSTITVADSLVITDGTEGISGECWISNDTSGTGNWDTCPLDGIGANAALSNLSGVALNSDLIWGSATAGTLKTADNGAGNSEDLNIETGTATGTRGTINLADGSEGTSGHVWTSTGILGEGNWAAAAGGGDLWSDPVDSNIVPDGAGTRNLGADGTQFDTVHAEHYLAELGTSGRFLDLSAEVSPDGDPTNGLSHYRITTARTVSTYGGAILGMFTGNESGNIQSGSTRIGTGDQTSANVRTTGDLRLYTGDITNASNSDDTGNIELIPGATAGAGSQGTINFVDGSEGTVGHVWTSTGTGGEGNWADHGHVTSTVWASYTPSFSGLGSGSGTITGKWRRVGDSVELQIFFKKDATAGTGTTTVVFGLPSGQLIDDTKFSSPTVASVALGIANTFRVEVAGETHVSITAWAQGINTEKIFILDIGDNDGYEGVDFRSNASVYLKATIPIETWTTNN